MVFNLLRLFDFRAASFNFLWLNIIGNDLIRLDNLYRVPVGFIIAAAVAFTVIAQTITDAFHLLFVSIVGLVFLKLVAGVIYRYDLVLDFLDLVDFLSVHEILFIILFIR